MVAQDWLAGRFEENRSHLRAVAYRMLGSLNDADDAVQEAWLRLSRSDAGDIDNLSGWLTTVVAAFAWISCARDRPGAKKFCPIVQRAQPAVPRMPSIRSRKPLWLMLSASPFWSCSTDWLRPSG